ncbi:chorismate-binding protein [Myceligenerans salitolerans]|uniref:Anthranilate synthase component I family protein n=1 Tax=Myceligenerans salitolerans TaxID=1230528 RepID=A0ABS3IC53_9MICO|nr:chorismate-binding protein [Myceligenerans salitolerans]MBO0610617.1 anthranilate synthase component I family protein [Myceligenerans salitolerans]
MTGNTGWAAFDGRVATHVIRCVDLHDEPEALARGTWFVVADFEGRTRAWQFRDVTPAPPRAADLGGRPGTEPSSAAGRGARPRPSPDPDAGPRTGPAPGAWIGPDARAWTSSMDRAAYEAAVRRIREHVREGDVYQANLCRILAAPLPSRTGTDGNPAEPDARALTARLAAGNPAPHASAIHVPAATLGPDGRDVQPVWVVSASPELYLSLEPGPDGTVVTSGPIKGTARTPDGLTDKDRAENVMITDLVRNDLQRVCRPGTVEVTGLLTVEQHPGLVHLVSHVRGVLSDDISHAPGLWRHLLAATFPPGSVSGAPKSSALRIIGDLEPVPRGPYCGAVGWVDGDTGTASLAVGIRTFWWERGDDDGPGAGTLRFGTGAGITWGSDPTAEWRETELKAARLVGLASSDGGPGTPRGGAPAVEQPVSRSAAPAGRMSP